MRRQRQAVRACLHWVSESESLCDTERFVTSDAIGRQEVLREQELAVWGALLFTLYCRVLHWLEGKHVIIQNTFVLVSGHVMES